MLGVANASNWPVIPVIPWGDNIADTGGTGDTGVSPGGVLNLNQTYSMSIQADTGHGKGDHYFFTTGNGKHTIKLTNLTTDVDMELYEWNGTQTIEELLNDYDDSPFFIGESYAYNINPETISTSSLVSGKKYLINLTEWNGTAGTFNLLISNP